MDLILTVNGGSSSLKCGLFEQLDGKLEGRYRFKFSNILNSPKLKLSSNDPGIGIQEIDLAIAMDSTDLEHRHQACLGFLFAWLGENLKSARLQSIGHRVVHGGEKFETPILVDDAVLQQLAVFNPLAPLHQPFNLRLIEVCQQLQPKLPQLACFDTMFHLGQPEVERHYAIPQKYTDAGIHKYGFHGLSYEYILQELIALDPICESQRIIVCHLGAGASMCAIKNGRSVASTMGFSAVDGLPMASRSGAIDPGVLLYLQRHYHMDTDALENFLYKECGWLGVSGLSSDMLTLKQSSEPAAQKAIDMFCYRAALEIGKLTAALQGVDKIVFTGGVGENDADIRAAIADQCGWLGAKLCADSNQEGRTVFSITNSAVCLLKIATNEELMIAQHCSTLYDH